MAAPLSAPTPSFAVTVRSIYSSGGLLAFSRGLGTSLLRAFPSNAMAFFVYEGILRNVGAEAVRIAPILFKIDVSDRYIWIDKTVTMMMMIKL